MKKPTLAAGCRPLRPVRSASSFAVGQALARWQAGNRRPGLELGADVLWPSRPVSPLRFTRLLD